MKLAVRTAPLNGSLSSNGPAPVERPLLCGIEFASPRPDFKKGVMDDYLSGGPVASDGERHSEQVLSGCVVQAAEGFPILQRSRTDVV